jgi:hypothetical protein
MYVEKIYVIITFIYCNAGLLPFAPGEHNQWAPMHRAHAWTWSQRSPTNSSCGMHAENLVLQYQLPTWVT